jgi:hypothetical protein
VRPSLVGAALLLVGCASSRPTVSAAEAFGAAREATPGTGQGAARAEAPRAEQAPRRTLSPEKWARGYVRPGECESAALGLAEESGREVGWTYVKACAARTDFGLLKRLIENWTPELKTKPEAATVLAQVIAHRGGLVKSDLMQVQQRRLPLFELSAAVRQPDAFKGRYLVFVGRIDKLKSVKGRYELVLAENARVEEDTSVFAEGSTATTSSRSGSASVSGSYRSDRMGSGSGQASGSYQGSSASRSGTLERRSMTTFEDTGQRVITRLATPDPYLSVDRNFLFLVRFDAARPMADESAEDEEPKLTAVVSLISYHDVSAVGAFDQ